MTILRALARPSVLLALLAICFLPGLGGDFIFDDHPNIVDRQAVHVTQANVNQLSAAASALGSLSNRPIPMVTFGIDHAIAGLEPRQYKMTNIALHALNAVLIFSLLKLLLQSAPGYAPSGKRAAFVLAALWAVHPLQVSTVLYVVQRMEILGTTFVVISLIFYFKGRRLQSKGKRAWPWLAGCVPAIGAGYLCKESALAAPALGLALELTLLNFRARNETTTKAWKAFYAASFLLAVALIPLLWAKYAHPDIYAMRDYSAPERLMTQLRVVPMYLGWILFPDPGSYHFYYDNYRHSTSLVDPWSTAFGAILLALLVAAAFAMRRKCPLFSLGIFWFLAAHAVTSSFIALELVFEHRNYLPILGVLVAAYGLLSVMKFKLSPSALWIAQGALVAGLCALTLVRSAAWGDPLHLAMDLAAKNPGSARASMDLGEQYMFRANRDPNSLYYTLAQSEYERGAAIPNSSPMPEQGLIVLAASSGVPAKPEWWDSINRKLSTRAVGPQETSMISGLLDRRRDGLEIDDKGLLEAYTTLVKHSKPHPALLYSFALHALDEGNRKDVGIELLMRAARESRGDPEFVAAIVAGVHSQGHAEEASTLADFARDELKISIEGLEATAGRDQAGEGAN